MGSIPRSQRGHRREADGTRADDDRDLAGLHCCRPDIELADRECVDHGDRIAGHIPVHDPGDRLTDNQQLGEAALRLGVLADDPRSVGSAVDQADGNGGHARADRERLAAPGPAGNHFTDELVAEHCAPVFDDRDGVPMILALHPFVALPMRRVTALGKHLVAAAAYLGASGL